MDIVRMGPRGILRAARLRAAGGPKSIVLDVDGTLTDGLMYVNGDGKKVFKAFSSDDSDAIREARRHGIFVLLITADGSAIDIVHKRALAMGCQFTIVPGHRRALFFEESEPGVVYVGDGWFDGDCFKAADFGVATANALPFTKHDADAVLSRRGGDKAVAQAIRFILKRLVRE